MFRKFTNIPIAALAGAVLAFSCGNVATAQDRAAERVDVTDRPSVKLYGGETLEVWRQRFGELNPSSEYAAELVSGLLEIVEDRQVPDALRERAAVTLGRIGKPAVAAVPVLGEILADRNAPLLNRVWAGRALGYFGKYASPATDALIDFLFDEDVPLQHRPVPVEALGLIGSGHPNVVPALLRLFQYTPDEHSSLSPGDVTFLRELATEAFAMMRDEADVVTPLLMRAVRDPSEVESIRRKSLVAIGQIGSNAAIAIPVLVESLEFDLSDAARDEAARALGKIGEPAYFVMEHYLAHPDPNVRWRIAAACGELKSVPPSIVVALQNTLPDHDEVVRMATLEALSKLATTRDEYLPVAIQLLTSEDRQIRMRAMRLILESRPLPPSATKTLEGLMSHRQPATSRIARHIAEKLNEATDE
jgi:HEAT repeat protein